MEPPASVIQQYGQRTDVDSLLNQVYNELSRTANIINNDDESRKKKRLVLPVGKTPTRINQLLFGRMIEMARLMRRDQLFLGTNNRVYCRIEVGGVKVCYAEDLTTWPRHMLIWLLGRARELRSKSY